MSGAAFFIVFTITVFCLGIAAPVFATKLVRSAGGFSSALVGVGRFIKRRAGYLASFGAGVLLTMFVLFPANPYSVARWMGAYDAAIVGRYILQDEQAMKTGLIPQAVLDKYFKSP